jgi:hypothetical protein
LDASKRERHSEIAHDLVMLRFYAWARLAPVARRHDATLRPFAVAMAGAGEFDPFKD